MSEEAKAAEPLKKRSRKPLVLGVVVAVIVVAGAGLWVWHGQPGFCSAVCHTPMAEYVATYEAQPGEAAVDKWGGEVSDASAMLAVSHKAKADANCLSCHVPSLSQQIGEVGEAITGDYYYPLAEVSTADLLMNSGQATDGLGDEFCLNEACHDVTRADLTELTADRARNPHAWEHGDTACGDCHKSHRASVMACTQCHSDAELPSGWLTYSEAQ